MNKQIYAVLSLVCGLLGFNLIAIAQTMSFMQLKRYMAEAEGTITPMIVSIGGTYKLICLVLGIAALILCCLYTKSPDNSARLFNGLGGILGAITVILSTLPIYVWLL